MLQYIINLIVFIPIIIILIVVSIKLSKINSDNIDRNKYVKVLEKTNLSKDNSIFVIKIGDEGCVLTSSPSKIEKIKDLTKEDIIEIENMKPNFSMNIPDIDISKLNMFKAKKQKGINSLTFQKNKPILSNFNKSNKFMFNKNKKFSLKERKKWKV